MLKSLDLKFYWYQELWNQDGRCAPLVLNHWFWTILTLTMYLQWWRISPDHFLEQGAGWRPYVRYRKRLHLLYYNLCQSSLKFVKSLVTDEDHICVCIKTFTVCNVMQFQRLFKYLKSCLFSNVCCCARVWDCIFICWCYSCVEQDRSVLYIWSG